MQEDNIAIRLKFLISELGINSSVFADNCGISRATLSQLLTGRNKKISDVLIAQIHKAYPDLSVLWLLFNEGEMWNDKGSVDKSNSQDSTEGFSSKQTNIELNEDGDSRRTAMASEIPSVTLSGTNKNLSENLDFSSNGKENLIRAKETSLNSDENTTDNIINQQLNQKLETVGLINEIEHLRSKIKKVVQITIYFDDSTFETFFPK